MIARGLNTEHHAIPDRYVCFIYNQEARWSMVPGYFCGSRTCTGRSRRLSRLPGIVCRNTSGTQQCDGTAAFCSDRPAQVHRRFSRFDGRPAPGNSPRGGAQGIIEGVAFYLKEMVDPLPGTGINRKNYRAVGGGSRSDAWVQTCADIFGRPFTRPVITEAGCLGAAIIAGVGSEFSMAMPRACQPWSNLRAFSSRT